MGAAQNSSLELAFGQADCHRIGSQLAKNFATLLERLLAKLLEMYVGRDCRDVYVAASSSYLRCPH
jgi:hypothetical protein